MKKIFYSQRAQSALEFITMVIFILGAFLVFQKYIAHGLAGRWKGIGDTFGQGRVYSESKTTECAYDAQYFDTWYDEDCYEANCDCVTTQSNPATCKDCIELCSMHSSNLPAYCTGVCTPICDASCTATCATGFPFCYQNCMAICMPPCTTNCQNTTATYDQCN